MLAVTVLGSGIAALDATMVNIALPTIQAPTLGWSSLTVLAMAVAGALGLAAFLVWDHTAAWPMLPLGVFREWQFAATNVATFIMYAALTGATFLPPIQLQVVSGYLPLASGLPLLPLTLIMLALSARSGRLATRIGPRLQMSAGPAIVGAGLALLVFSNYGSSYVVCVLPAVVVFGLGRGHGRAPHRNRDELGAGIQVSRPRSTTTWPGGPHGPVRAWANAASGPANRSGHRSTSRRACHPALLRLNDRYARPQPQDSTFPKPPRSAARRAFSANFPITQGDAVFKSRVHAAAACVLPSRAVQGRPGAPRDQARQPQLIRRADRTRLATETIKCDQKSRSSRLSAA